MRFFTAFLFMLLAAWPAPSFAAVSPAQSAPLRVVASFSILADMARQIGGADVSVMALVGPDADTHTYQPTPQDVRKLVAADVILVNGLGFEGWMQRLAQASGTHAQIVTISSGIAPLRLNGAATDPHAWQDLRNGRIYARNIAAAFAAALPARAAAIRARAEQYDQALAAMDGSTRAAFVGIPAAKRKIITGHDAFGYFGAAYGVTFLAPVGLNTDAEPSASGIAALIGQIKSEGIAQLFIENLSNPNLIEQIGRDTGATMGGTLYSDALSGPNGPAPTYLDMFKNNVPKLRAAMLLNRG